MSAEPARLLIIAGSDSSGGAGIQADIKTATLFGVYAMTAITAITVQDTQRVHSVHLPSPNVVRNQIRVCLNDIGANAIKVGMLGSAEIVAAVAGTLKRHARGVPIVLDPVIISTSGKRLLVTGFPYDPTPETANLDHWTDFARRAQALRRLGSIVRPQASAQSSCTARVRTDSWCHPKG